ncbi:MAG: YeeE/YedE thiosulfate transporter family protein [Bacteroidota bacterium]
MWDAIIQPWPWYVAGPLIALVMFLLLYFGESFGVSGNLKTICSACGAGKHADFFRFDWKRQRWNLVFVIGGMFGGLIAAQFMTPSEAIDLATPTVEKLDKMGFANPGQAYLPEELFGFEQLYSFKGMLLLLIGGVLVGFGTRYAGGCTSGHAISGMSNLQLPSLIAVIGFFLGGLTMTHLMLPLLF